MPMATKVGKMVAHQEEHPLKKGYDLSVTWFSKVM